MLYAIWFIIDSGVLLNRIFMPIPSDHMRSEKLLFDLKDCVGDFPLGSTYLHLLVIRNAC